MLRDLVHALLDLVLPSHCVGCRRSLASRSFLCDACARRLGAEPAARSCLRCGEATSAREPTRCARCARRRSPLYAVIAAGSFERELAQWIHRFKYPATGLRGLDPAADALSIALVHASSSRLRTLRVDRVCAVPPDPVRLRARGFHPAGRLAAEVAGVIGVPCLDHALRVTRHTVSQTALDRAARRRNVRGAIGPGRDAAATVRMHVLVVDDVTTTTATLEECARALRRAGASRVSGFVLARTPRDR